MTRFRIRISGLCLSVALLAQLVEPFVATAQSGEPASAIPTVPRREYVDSTGVTVDRLIELGLERRADLAAAREQVAAAEGQVVQAGLLPNPTLEAGYGPPQVFGEDTKREIEVGVSQVFELGGKRARRSDVARFEREKTRAEVSLLERQIAADIRSSYVRALAANRQLELLALSISANEELQKATEIRVREGDVAPLDLRLIEIETNKLRAESLLAMSELDAEMVALRASAVIRSAESLRISPLPDRVPRPAIGSVQLVEIALRDRFDLKAARLTEDLEDARLALARSDAVPDITASVLYSGTASREETSIVGTTLTREKALRFGIGIDIPVFNRNQGNIATAAAAKARATKEREYLELQIRRDVDAAFVKARAAAEALDLYANSIVPAARAVVAGVRRGYDLGEFNIFDVLAEQRKLIDAETAYGRARATYLEALTELERAVGGPLLPSAFRSAAEPASPDPITVNPSGMPDGRAFGSSLRHQLGTSFGPTSEAVLEPAPINSRGNKQ